MKLDAIIDAVQPPATATPGTAERAPAPARVPKAIIVIDLQTIIEGPHEATVAELQRGPDPTRAHPRPAARLRHRPRPPRGTGQPLWVGCTHRTATPAQRDALTAIYRGCARNSCRTPTDDTHAHHTEAWKPGGETNVDVLAPVRSADHDAVHNGGHRIEVDDNHTSVTRYRPDGSIEYTGHHRTDDDPAGALTANVCADARWFRQAQPPRAP